MIAPNMATMLAFFTTDAAVEPRAPAPRPRRGGRREPQPDHRGRRHLDQRLRRSCSRAARARARAIDREGPAFDAFRGALTEAAPRSSREMLVRDGEGVTRIAEVRVEGARTAADADRDRPHRGRVAAREDGAPRRRPELGPRPGRASAAPASPLDIARVSIWIGDVHVAEGGAARDYDEKTAAAAMQEDPVRLRVRLGEGGGLGWMWTSDFSHGYVDINAHYRS